MKTLTGAIAILGICAALVLGSTILENRGQRQAQQSERAIRELDARVAESEKGKAEAEALPDVVRENWRGLTEHAETVANLERDRAQTDALIDLALADLRAREQWRGFVLGMFGLAVFSAIGGGSLYLVYRATLGKDAGNVREKAKSTEKALYG